jgi:hypothetical protein
MNLPDFNQYCEAACIKLWGEPDKRSGSELRWNGADGYSVRTYSVPKKVWYDHGVKRGGSTLELAAFAMGWPQDKPIRGADFYAVWQGAYERGLYPDPPREKKGDGLRKDLRVRRFYSYPDEQGVLLYQVIRYDTEVADDRFGQRRPDGEDGWIGKLGDVRRVLYRLPELIEAVKAGKLILDCEGENDAEAAVELGYVATTHPGGIGKWRDDYDEFFRDADVVVVADNDAHGKGQADAKVRAQHISRVAKRVRIIMFDDVKDLREWVSAFHTREELDAIIEMAEEIAPPPPPPPAELPVIMCVGGQLLAVIEAAENAILAAPQQRLFQRGGMLVRLKRIAQKETIKGITRDAGSLIIAEATPECVRLEMARTARYQKWNERKRTEVETDPLISYARALAAKNEFPFKTLLATIETPTLRPDGSVLQERGYDEASGLYFDSAQTFPTISSNPSRDDAARALREIDDVLKDFPFVDGGGAVAVAAILTALVRRVLLAAPMFLFDAPVQASGKSLLASVVGWIATGRDPATQPYTGDAEEDRKRIIATLIAGDAVVSFDNISKPLQDDTLCKVITQPVADDRLLCTMTNLKLPTCTTWLGTGVNLVVTGRDMVRRVLKCRIDPGMERPEERKFDYVLRDYVMERRAKLIAAALTIMRAYIAAGRPPQNIAPFGGFEEWSNMVRAPLVWLGCADPCASRDDIEDADPDTEKLTSLLDALVGRFKDNGITTAEVVKTARRDALDAAANGTDLSALNQAVAALCWNGEINPTAVGKAFAKYRGRIVGRRRLITVGTRQRALIWKVEAV